MINPPTPSNALYCFSNFKDIGRFSKYPNKLRGEGESHDLTIHSLSLSFLPLQTPGHTIKRKWKPRKRRMYGKEMIILPIVWMGANKKVHKGV